MNVIQSIDYTVAKNYTSDTFSLKNYVESNPESYILFQISIDMEYFDYFLVKDIHDQFLGEKIKAIYILRTREEEIKEAQLKLIKKSGNESFTVLIATDKELEKLMNTLYPNEILYPLQFIVNNNNHTIIKIQMVSEEDMLNEVYRYMNSDSHFEW